MYDIQPVRSLTPYDCGATCLKMLLSYYGIESDHEALLAECKARPWYGCSAKDVMQAGRAHGLTMTAWRMDAEDVLNADRPAIIWWGGGHFVLFCGAEGESVFICDPDFDGVLRVGLEQFQTQYSGVALFNGTPRDLKEGDTP